MKKVVSLLIVLTIAVLAFPLATLASGPNYATNTEHWTQLYYDGYVQIQSSFNDNGYHAARGYIRYIQGSNDTGRLLTDWGSSASDSSIHSRSYRFWDTLNPFAPATQFYYGFTWVPHGSLNWPA